MTKDLASSLVLAMLNRSLARQGIAAYAPKRQGARMLCLAEKKTLVRDVLEAYGPDAILNVAEVVPEFADHPVASAFVTSRTPQDAIGIWLAVECYFHSRHRTRCLAWTENSVAMEHIDASGQEISPGETLVVAGILLGILRWLGARGASVQFDGDARSVTSGWVIAWEHFEPSLQGNPGWIAVVPPTVDYLGRRIGDNVVVRLFGQRLERPHDRTRAADIACRLGMSLRSLQRHLAAHGWTLSDITLSSRVHLASRLLAETDTPLALVGLLAGFSDQPHFQRAFRKAIGPTPAEYRHLPSRIPVPASIP